MTVSQRKASVSLPVWKFLGFYIVLHSHLNELEHKSGGTPKPVTWIVGGATEKHKTENIQRPAIHLTPAIENTHTSLWT